MFIKCNGSWIPFMIWSQTWKKLQDLKKHPHSVFKKKVKMLLVTTYLNPQPFCTCIELPHIYMGWGFSCMVMIASWPFALPPIPNTFEDLRSECIFSPFDLAILKIRIGSLHQNNCLVNSNQSVKVLLHCTVS